MATETSVLTGLEPRSFWGHFETLTTIPRPSRPEEPVIEHVRAWASRTGSSSSRTPGATLSIRVAATPGRESAPTVILQGHLDMVCERDPASPNDPAEGRIALVRDGEWLTADGTTLGADDGIAIAAMMALVEDESLPHGPLELLMTVAEEVGLEGANALDGSLLTGSTLINLDSEEDGPSPSGAPAAPTPGSGSTRRASRLPRRGHALRRGERRAGRPLRCRDRASGAPTRSRCSVARCARPMRRFVPARLAQRRQEPQRDPPRRGGGLLGDRATRTAFRSAIESATATYATPTEDGSGRHGRRSTAPTAPADAWTEDGDSRAAGRGRARADRARSR